MPRTETEPSEQLQVAGSAQAAVHPDEDAAARTAAYVLQPLDFLVQAAGKLVVCLVLPCELPL